MKFPLSIKFVRGRIALTRVEDADWSLWVILIVAFLFRFLYLALKPPHFDEGINGWFVDQLISNGYYRYDPTNYHGPFHFYVLLLFKFLMGRNLWALRLPSVIFGFLGVYLIAKLEPYIGKFTAYTAALFIAVSPGMIFYTRYAIHESELFFFSLLALHGFLRYHTRKDAASLWQMGLGVVGMAITKETFVLHMACFGIAWLCLVTYERMILKLQDPPYVRPAYTRKDLFKVFVVSALVFVLFYSGFFLHMQGVVDFFRSFTAWIKTGQKGNGHEKPFYYWFTLFYRYEFVALAGLALCLKLLFPATRWLRLIGIYGVGVFLAYSIIHYKTPWCILNIVWPFYVIAASVLGDLAAHGAAKKKAMVVAAAAFAVLGSAQSIRLNFFHYTDETEPYVYVQTFSDIMGINDKVQTLAKRDPSKYAMSIKLFMNSQWPIPWLFGDFTRVGYYGSLGANDPDADLILVDANEKGLMESRLKKAYYVQEFRLRSAQEPAYAYFDMDTFKSFFDGKTQVFKPAPPEPLKPGAGLLAEYFQNSAWAGNPVIKKVVPEPNFALENAQRPLPAPFGILYSGEIFIPETGPRTFFLSSDDGSQLALDDRILISNLGAHPDQMKSGMSVLTKGWHKLKIWYNDFGGGMVLRLWWAGPSGMQEDITPSDYRIRKLGP